MKTGKEPFKCGIRIAECGMGDPQITQITQISFPPSAASAKSADNTSRPPSSDFRHRPASCVRHATRCPSGIWNGERDRPGRRLQRPVANIFQSHSARTPNTAGETPALPPIVHPKMKTGKEPFKCGIRIAECGMGDPQITQITQISFPPSAASAKSADNTSRPPSSDFRHRPASCAAPARPVAPAAFVGVEVTRLISISDWRLRIADFSE